MTRVTRTVDETLERFTFVHGSGAEDTGTACIMTATAWRMGLKWSDTPDCTHPIIRSAVVRLNDRMRTDDLADAFRLLADAIVGTASLPDTRAAWCVAGISSNGTMEGVAAFAARLSDTISATDLTEADFRGADFHGADFYEADFRGADFRGADFRQADLDGVNFDGANLEGADFNGANLDGASLMGAKASTLTVWPARSYPAARGVVTA